MPGWRPGTTTAYVKAACCPNCGSGEIHNKGGNGNSDQDMTRWFCPRCTHRWKLAAKSHGRAVVLG